MKFETCKVYEAMDPSGYKKVIMENEKLLVSILPEKGSDIYEFIYKPKKTDVLWKNDIGLRKPPTVHTAANSHVSWSENYEGGWQEIFPNGGTSNVYKGVELNFHGEASTLAWEYEIVIETAEKISLLFRCRMARSPFLLEKQLTLEHNESFLHIHEKIMNLADEDMDFMWGHHPAFGFPFLDENVIIDLPTNCWIESQNRENKSTRIPLKHRYKWPKVLGKDNEEIDFSVVPEQSNRSADLAFLGGFDEGWYAITNPKLGFGFAMAWPKTIFPYMWLWQEFRGSYGWPWYGKAYVMALEPFSSYDESGLSSCIANGTAKSIPSGQSLTVELIAGCFESEKGVRHVNFQGIELKDG